MLELVPVPVGTPPFRSALPIAGHDELFAASSWLRWLNMIHFERRAVATEAPVK